MRKNILTAIVALAFTSLTAFAQTANQTEKEYSMIVTLQNGTTITLGHNDIKNITFTGDSIAASGNIVSTIAKLQKNFEATDSVTQNTVVPLAKQVEENSYGIKDNQARIEKLESYITDVKSQTEDNINSLNSMIDYSMDVSDKNIEATKQELLIQIAALKATIDDLQSQVDALKGK